MDITKVNLSCYIESLVSDSADQATLGPKSTLSVSLIDELTDGDGTDQANQVYYDAQTVGASATVTYDLAGSLEDIFGDTITFLIIKGIIIYNSSTAGIINVGGGSDGAGTNAFDTWITSTAADGSEAVIVQPGGIHCLWAPGTGYVVTAGTGDLLGIEETAAEDCTIQVGIIGEVA